MKRRKRRAPLRPLAPAGVCQAGRFRFGKWVEHSVYVEARFRRRGVGRRLLQELIAAAQGQDYHILVGGIDATNLASIRLHEALGFVHCGTIRQAGFKFGRWLDLSFYQRILTTPAHPIDG